MVSGGNQEQSFFVKLLRELADVIDTNVHDFQLTSFSAGSKIDFDPVLLVPKLCLGTLVLKTPFGDRTRNRVS